MKQISKRFLSVLLVAAMIFSVLPTVFAAQTEEETYPTESVSLPKRAETNTFTQITSYSDLTDGNYVLLAEANGSYSEASYYAVQAAGDSTYKALLCVAADFTSVPSGVTATSGLTWSFTYSNSVLTIKDSSGNYLADTSGSSSVSLVLSSSSCTWTPTLYTDGSWAFYSSNNRYLSLRDELATTATNGNPLVCVASALTVGSCYFYLYKQVETEECTHSYTYASNGDGTHTVSCANDCGYSATEDCTMSGGVCSLCDYEEIIEYTVEFIVPGGVNAVEPVVGSEVVFPTPSGTPNYNYNDAVFVGWTDAEVDNSATVPTIYDTSSLYTLTEDLTLYALYAYTAGNTFVLFDGSSALSVGQKAIIAARDFDYALSLTQNKNNRAAEAITKVDDTITLPSDSNVAVLTVEYGVNGSSEPTQYSFRDDNGYLTSASSSSNYLRTSDTVDANSTWCYTLDSTSLAISITAQGEYERNTIRYNTSALFACYDSTNTNLKDVQLYVLSADGSSIYTTVFSDESCLHEYTYTSKEDGTHTVTCTNNCGYSISEDCSISDGVCSSCGYEEPVEYMVSFIVPAGVTALEPITASEVTLPVPSGTPDNNTHNAAFVGWTTDVVDHESSVAVIYDTNTTYTLDSDLTLYALYAYGDSMSFTLYDGSYDLQIGDRVIIVAADYDYAVSTTQNNNNRAAEAITKNSSTITLAAGSNAAVFTIDYGVNGADEPSNISFLDDQGYLTSASSSGNYLRTAEILSANSTWSYSVDTSTYAVTLTSQGTYTRNTIRYNSSSTLFACYAADSTTQKDVQLYIQSNEGSNVYTTEFEEACLHEFSYETNSDGTHNVVCINDCGYSAVEDCDLTDGTCPSCGYGETLEFTVTFVVPDGVDAIEPMVGCTMTFPAPTGTPNNNYYNATFVGWAAAEVNNSEISPFYYEANVEYDVEYDLTLYALYSYSNSTTLFELYDGSYKLEEGAQAIIVAKDYDYAISTTQNTNNRAPADVVKNDDNTITLSASSDVAVFTLGWGVDGSSNTNLISFKDTNGYLRAASSSGNYLRTGDTLDASSTWAYALDTSDYSITFTSQGEYTRNTMRYNKSSNLFACYAADNTNQAALQLYLQTSEGSYIYTTVFSAGCTHINTTTETVDPTCEESGSVTVTCDACGEIISESYVAAHGHSYDAQETLPTCTENGYAIYTCASCGDVYTEDLVSEGHAYGDGVAISTLSCTTDGVTTYTCANCGDSYTETVSATGHAYNGVITTVASCTTDGVKTFTCANCSDIYTETISATGHAYDSGVITTVASCTSDGLKTFTCANCGDSYTETVSATGHNYGSGVVTSQPTCTTEGVTTFTCTNCGDEIVEVETALGHVYDNGVVIEVASCLTNGSMIYTCTRCNESKTETVQATGHTYTTTVKPATCLEGGYTSYLCTSCGDTYEGNYVASTGHNYDVMIVDPTCTTEGYTSFICPDCGDAFTSDNINPTGHNYSTTVVEANCTESGSTTYNCSNCGDTYTETIPAIGHQIVFVPKVPASCFAEGTVEHYKCTACSKYFIDANGSYEVPESYLPLPATGHTLVYVEKVAASCTTEGNVAHYKCSGCGKLYVDESASYEVPEGYIVIAASGHSYTTSVTAPTCTTDGFTTHTCSSCGDSYTSDPVNALTHNFIYTDNGETHTQTCLNCNESVTNTHDWDAGQDLTEGTCTAYSKFSYTCTTCSAVKVVTNGEPNHALVFFPETYATCENDGCTEHYACTQCGKLYVDADALFELPESYVKIPATGHTLSYTNNGTNHTVTCSSCDYNESVAHSFTDGVCICGASESDQPKYVPNSNLTLTMSISVGAEMQVIYNVLNSKVKSFESFYIEVVKEVAGGESVTTVFSLDNNNLTAATNTSGAISRYMATYTGIFAMEMGDNFTATVYAVAADGTINYGPSVSSSIKTFLMGKLTDTTASAEIKTLAVDMLNYGAAAQINFNYDVDNLVNSDLTEEQKALGTQTIPTAVDGYTATGSGSAVITSVSLQSKVMLYLTFRYRSTTDSNLKVVIKDAEGKVLSEYAPYQINTANCKAIYDNVGARQMRELITIELYDNDVLVSQSITWSVESYVAQVRADSASTEAQINAVNAMLAYGDSAAAYLEASGQ